jgi:hypothetical protein
VAVVSSRIRAPSKALPLNGAVGVAAAAFAFLGQMVTCDAGGADPQERGHQFAAESGRAVGAHDVGAVQRHGLVDAVVHHQRGRGIQQVIDPFGPRGPAWPDEPQAPGDQVGVNAEQLQAFDGAGRVGFLVVDVDDVMAVGEFGGHTPEREPGFTALGFPDEGVFAAGVDQLQPVGAVQPKTRLGLCDLAAQPRAEVDGFPGGRPFLVFGVMLGVVAVFAGVVGVGVTRRLVGGWGSARTLTVCSAEGGLVFGEDVGGVH